MGLVAALRRRGVSGEFPRSPSLGGRARSPKVTRRRGGWGCPGVGAVGRVVGSLVLDSGKPFFGVPLAGCECVRWPAGGVLFGLVEGGAETG